MQLRDGLVSSESTVLSDHESDDSRMWYVRLRIRDDRLAKIWAWNLAEHDAIVWSDAEERWKQLLAIPELRAEVRKATTSAYVRKRTTSDAPPAHSTIPPTLPNLVDDIDFDDAPTRTGFYAEPQISAEDSEPTRVRHRPSSGIPVHVDPLLQALTTTSIPPAVLTNPPPEIPRAPRLPSFGQGSARAVSPVPVQTPANANVGFGDRAWHGRRLLENSRDFATAKNIGWALLPVVCAAIFAIVLYRHPESSLSGASSANALTSDGTILEWLLDDQKLAEKLAAKLTGVSPVCSGQPQTNEPPAILSPEQLRPIPDREYKTGFTPIRTKPVAVASTTRAQAASLKSGSSSAGVAVTEGAEFDPDAARTALKFAIARAKNCSNAGVSGSVLVTFAPSGTVKSVQIAQFVGDDAEPSCISRAFSVSRVPPFVGNAVTVRKSF